MLACSTGYHNFEMASAPQQVLNGRRFNRPLGNLATVQTAIGMRMQLSPPKSYRQDELFRGLSLSAARISHQRTFSNALCLYPLMLQYSFHIFPYFFSGTGR
jgi:hypothetical protein